MEIRLRSILGYLFGIPILLIGLIGLATSIVAGIALLLAGAIATPFTRRLFQRKTGITFSTGAAGGIPAILVLIGVVALAMAGAGVTAPGDDVSNVSVDHQNLEADNPDNDVHVTYNTRAQTSVNPDQDSMTHYSSNDGEKYLVARMQIENQGDSTVDLLSRWFRVETDGVIHDPQLLFGSGNDLNVELQPGASHSGWVVFPLSEDTTDATLQVTNESVYNKVTAVEFEHDPSMDINMET